MAEFWMVSLPPPGEAGRLAEVAEDSGWDGVGFADTQNLAADPYVALAVAAKRTRSIRLRTAVTNPVTRDPAVTANAIASVHAESNGRAVLGIGRGDSSVAKIGKQPATLAEFETYIERVRGYLRGQRVDRGGAQSVSGWIGQGGALPPVPIDVAASGRKAIDVAVRTADQVTFAVGADVERLRSVLAYARERLVPASRDPAEIRFGAYVNAVTHPDADVAARLARGPIATFMRFSSGSPAGSGAGGFNRIRDSYDMDQHASSQAVDEQTLSPDMVRSFGVVGTPSECRDRFAELREVGLNHFVLIGPGEDVDLTTKLECWAHMGREVIAKL